ncbi:MAG: NAD(P)-dependent oxidoreductase, partial [Planctomycetaceae bacterium]|nr:NAD(P)-dependent oxidoreductase [Planctomycetaceae bacterium]
MSTVGFIGLGTMGRPMAKNLIKAGHQLVFFARKPEIVSEFTALGAKSAATPAEVTKLAEFVVTIVTADPQLTEIVLGDNGIVHGASAGKMLIDMSTVGAQTEQQLSAALAERGMKFIDAPVSGGPWGAEAGTLAIMVGGAAEDYERALPVLQAMGQKIFHLGPVGCGQTVKLVNQMVGGGIMTLIAEGFVLG